jgi:hypothetical protein
MKIIIKEQQLEGLASRFALEKLNGMDFKLKKYNEFSFFPKGEGRKDADHGIEADWVKGEGYSILVGNSLWRSVRDLFGLTDDQTQTAFIKAFIEKGIRKISEVTTIDFSGVEFPVIEEQVSNEILSYLLENLINGYEIKFEVYIRNVYVNGKLMAQLGPSSGVVSLDAFNQLKDNLFFSSDKDLREEVSNWVRDKFKSKNNIGKYGISFKKLHGQERDLPKKIRKPHHAIRQDKLEPGFDLQGFKKRTTDIETRLKNKEDLIRVAMEKQNPDSFANWMKREVKKDLEREKQRKEEMNLTKALEAIRNAKKK